MSYLVLVLVLVRAPALLVSQPAPGDAQSELRTWHSSDGNYALRAALLDTDGQQVRLRKPDGSIVTVPIAKLSAADREFLAAPGTTTPSADGELASERSARAALESLGLRIGSSGLTLADEPKLGRMMREVTNLRKNVMSADSGLAQQERKEAEIKRQLTALLALDVNLNAQLAQVRLGDTVANNRLVATINANRSQVELLRTSLRQQGESVQAARAAASGAREAYLQAILAMRELADRVTERYAELAASGEAKTALEQFNAASGKTWDLAPSRNFQRLLVRLAALEDTVLSESIPLRRVGGGSLLVSVVIDGQHTLDMTLDSGANLVTLPRDVAEKCGIQVRPGDEQIVMGLADGSRIQGHLVTIESVRVGKFTVQHVPCAVLGADAANAPSLLGMSFLEHFKFQVDAAKGTLSLVQIRADSDAFRNE